MYIMYIIYMTLLHFLVKRRMSLTFLPFSFFRYGRTMGTCHTMECEFMDNQVIVWKKTQFNEQLIFSCLSAFLVY